MPKKNIKGSRTGSTANVREEFLHEPDEQFIKSFPKKTSAGEKTVEILGALWVIDNLTQNRSFILVCACHSGRRVGGSNRTGRDQSSRGKGGNSKRSEVHNNEWRMLSTTDELKLICYSFSPLIEASLTNAVSELNFTVMSPDNVALQ